MLSQAGQNLYDSSAAVLEQQKATQEAIQQESINDLLFSVMRETEKRNTKVFTFC